MKKNNKNLFEIKNLMEESIIKTLLPVNLLRVLPSYLSSRIELQVNGNR